MNKPGVITRNVLLLSAVSLFTDVASEMLYPVMPVYLKSIGFSILLIGILEGFAEATAGLSKGYFGKASDNSGKRLPFVQIGYTLSSISKPMMALYVYPLWVFAARSLDRLGKGIRTGARDALLSDEADSKNKGRVFGFHRAMDTLGAVIGPLLALWYLQSHPGDYKTLFYVAFLPGMLAILLSMLIREKQRSLPLKPVKTKFGDFLKYWKDSPPQYRKLTSALLLFTLFNSSDVFLLLKMKTSGFDDGSVIGVYIFYNLIYALFAYPLGVLADKLGMKIIYMLGLILFAATYAGMALFEHKTAYLILFFLYGIYAAATEGIAKAWISNICSKSDTATAIGTYTAFQSIATLLASSLAGMLWFAFGASAAFLVTAVAVVPVLILIRQLNSGPGAETV